MRRHTCTACGHAEEELIEATAETDASDAEHKGDGNDVTKEKNGSAAWIVVAVSFVAVGGGVATVFVLKSKKKKGGAK